MRISEYYKLGKEQHSLDFIDIDIFTDVRVFVDPRALRLLQSQWGDECTALVQNYFKVVLTHIRNSRNREARQLLGMLREPNETHLGVSQGKSRGRGLGPTSARSVWESLSSSEAVKSGLLEDLEDTILMVPYIAEDIVSDIVTNVIREPLIRYTQEVCEAHGIPLVDGIDSGPMWDPGKKQWYSEFVRLPIADGDKLLLVPKILVRRKMDYNLDEYYRHYVLEYLRAVEFSRPNSDLVELLKDGRTRVTIKSLKAKYGQGKKAVVDLSHENPTILENYRREKGRTLKIPLSHEEIAEAIGIDDPNWDELIDEIKKIQPGRAQANDYERAIEKLLTALFYPALANPDLQSRIHEGRKIVDIRYTNAAQLGFFHWLTLHYPAAHIFVECKNYSGKVANPELDQLSGRFSPSRGRVGLLVCRQFDDKSRFIERCRDTAQDDRGYIIPLEDSDLEKLVNSPKTFDDSFSFGLLKERFDHPIM